MFLREMPDLFLYACNGAATVFRELMENAEVPQKTQVGHGDLLRSVAAVKFTQQAADGFQTHRIRVAAEKTFAAAKLRNKPDANETTLHAISLDAEFGFDRRKLAGILHHSRQPLLWIANLEQLRETLLLLPQQGARISMARRNHARAN